VKFDVIVIGAGAAGLACARSLSGAGKRVCIIEGRDRIGGRIDTRRVPGINIPIELGAEFVHGESETTFGIVDAAALTAYELPDDHWWSRNGSWSRIPDFWGDIARVRKPIARLTRDISFEQFLRRQRKLPSRLRSMAWNFVEGYHAAHADRISALVLASSDEEQSGDNKQFRIADGYDRLMLWLAAGLDPERCDLRLGTVANRVQWKKGGVAVECTRSGRDETIRARALVITVPIGVWKAGTIRFDPALEEKERVIAKLESGHVMKIVFRFRERWWDEFDFNFVHTNDKHVPTWWSAKPLRAPILTGWAGGHAADAMLAESPESRIDRALDAMSSAFAMTRRDLDDLFIASYSHDWQSDPLSRCAYSYASVGGSSAHKSFAKPIDETLFFAGEATSSDETGTVSGAIESGRRASTQMLGR
jgi:monoamine oxidase